VHGTFHRRRPQTAAHRAPRLLALDQPGTGQHVEMLHHRRQGHRERSGDLGHGQLRLTRQAIDDGAPRRVGERREGKIELGVAIVNHVVKCCHSCPELSWFEKPSDVHSLNFVAPV